MDTFADLQAFQEKLGYFFSDRGLLRTALCHASYANEAVRAGEENHDLPQSNERLEFLGDSVLGLVTAHVLYETYSEAAEGELSSCRVEFVCRDALVRWAESLDLGDVLMKGKSLKGSNPQSLVADAMEAVLGAVYLDGGYDAAVRTIRRYLFRMGTLLPGMGEPDAKSKLQIFLQADDGELPRYEVLSMKGPSHSPLFSVQVHAVGKTWRGEGTSRKAAELDAAAAALAELENESGNEGEP